MFITNKWKTRNMTRFVLNFRPVLRFFNRDFQIPELKFYDKTCRNSTFPFRTQISFCTINNSYLRFLTKFRTNAKNTELIIYANLVYNKHKLKQKQRCICFAWKLAKLTIESFWVWVAHAILDCSSKIELMKQDIMSCQTVK